MNTKNTVIGILAHVDSGKTTLSEAFLYLCGEIRKLGRVDRRDAFLDTNEIERDRGITIFSKQAVFKNGDTTITLLDTPGHVDFSAEAERTLSVLDYAVLVVSATDGVQSHTAALWKILQKYNVPVFIFVNKMDMAGTDKSAILSEIKEKLSDNCFDFVNIDNQLENIAMSSEYLMNEFLKTDNLSNDSIAYEIKNRKIFPCYFGSALKTDGVDKLLNGLDLYTVPFIAKRDFGAKVYKISSDDKGQRLTHMKITGGELNVKDIINGEKLNELRIYNGVKYNNIQKALPGTVCVVTGLNNTFSGQGLGIESNSDELSFQPVFSYKIDFPEGTDLTSALKNLKRLEEEDSQLHIVWNSQLEEIHIQLMGEVQSEVLKRIISDRFNMKIEFSQGGIVYKETIKDAVLGVGHFEPLRHYAEVHIMLEPAPVGSGIIFRNNCHDDSLDKNWQNLIMTHLKEKTHIGVLTGSPVTDIKISLVAARAHKKHTEGGDFRQATYRAVRQGLMQAQSVLLEPWYSFVLELPTANLGRAMTDIQNMNGNLNSPEQNGDISILKGSAPVSKMSEYQKDVTAYTRGAGHLRCTFDGYRPCTNQQDVIDSIGYNCEHDTENTADSVFCSHGAGFIVKWDEVFNYMHIERTDEKNTLEAIPQPTKRKSGGYIDEQELIQIFERTYGKIQRKTYQQLNTVKERTEKATPQKPKKPVPIEGEYLLIDGYNILFSWFDLQNADSRELDYVRNLLIDRISNYSAMNSRKIIIVFDAYKVKDNPGSIEQNGNVTVVYTKEAETADSYIEKAVKNIGKNYRTWVATSDRLEQIIIFGTGVFRISAQELLKEIEATEQQIKELMDDINN